MVERGRMPRGEVLEERVCDRPWRVCSVTHVPEWIGALASRDPRWVDSINTRFLPTYILDPRGLVQYHNWVLNSTLMNIHW